jgi:hypothetical protein
MTVVADRVLEAGLSGGGRPMEKRAGPRSGTRLLPRQG